MKFLNTHDGKVYDSTLNIGSDNVEWFTVVWNDLYYTAAYRYDGKLVCSLGWQLVNPCPQNGVGFGHQWKEYHGFSWDYKYCIYCDTKENL